MSICHSILFLEKTFKNFHQFSEFWANFFVVEKFINWPINLPARPQKHNLKHIFHIFWCKFSKLIQHLQHSTVIIQVTENGSGLTFWWSGTHWYTSSIIFDPFISDSSFSSLKVKSASNTTYTHSFFLSARMLDQTPNSVIQRVAKQFSENNVYALKFSAVKIFPKSKVQFGPVHITELNLLNNNERNCTSLHSVQT